LYAKSAPGGSGKAIRTANGGRKSRPAQAMTLSSDYGIETFFYRPLGFGEFGL